jgi:hypothetical protein
VKFNKEKIMPNNITNRIEFIGEKQHIDELVKNFSTYNGEKFTFPDFNKIVTRPENLNIESSTDGDKGIEYLIENAKNRLFEKELVKPSDEAIELGRKYLHNIADYGFKNWYDWSTENWGTKWNAYSCSKISENIYQFETAWSCVSKLINKISKLYPKVEIIYKWADEDTGFNCGIIKYLDGEKNGGYLHNESNDAYELCFELNPDKKNNYKLINGKYEFIGEE